MIDIIIQIILSLFLISIMALISYSIYNKEYYNSVTSFNNNKKQTNIFTGIFDFSSERDLDIETYDTNLYSYLDINPSVNQNGGAEYSYNFWLFFDLKDGAISNDSNFNIIEATNSEWSDHNKYKYIILFYKGEKTISQAYSSNNLECENNANVQKIDKGQRILIKNPLVKIRNDAKEIIIEYNNINYPETYNNSAVSLNCSDIKVLKELRNNNKFGIKNINTDILKQRFNMITIVFQENPKSEEIFNNTNANCRIYFNGELYEDRLANTNNIESDTIDSFKSRVMKSNYSKLHINPTKANPSGNAMNPSISKLTLEDKITTISPLQLADLTYYNYALTNKEIIQLYKNGFSKNTAIYKKNDFNNYIKGDNNVKNAVEPI
jgi:hypothetical protein